MYILFLLFLSSLYSSASAQDEDLAEAVDAGFLIISGAFVFYMQAGFSMLEVGAIMVKSSKHILMKNVIDMVVGALVFWACGFAFTYGEDGNDFIGWGNFFLNDAEGIDYAFFFFQYGFASASTTIISGCLAGRTTVIAYILLTIVMFAWTFPVLAHWLWGGGWLTDLGENGFLDFAGSGIVHLTGGVTGLVGCIIVGPRLGRFKEQRTIHGYSTTLVTLGAYILWFGWYGFNVGSVLSISNFIDTAGLVSVNTSLGPCAGMLTCLIVMKIITKRWDITSGINGALVGLVSICASCSYTEPWAALIIGAVGGLCYLGMSRLLVKLKIDDPLDAAAVHAAGGCWGVIAVGIFAKESLLRDALDLDSSDSVDETVVYAGGFKQLGIQLLGACVIIGWASFFCLIVLVPLKFLKLVRYAPEIEERGLDSDGYGANSWARVVITQDDKAVSEFQFRIQ